MVTGSTPGADGTESIDEVLAAYLKAVDAGEAPKRADILARYPHLVSDLEDFFVQADRLERYTDGLSLRPNATEATATMSPGSEAHIDSSAHATTIADNYELQGIIAKGGMGIIYRARDRRLNRQVAVKMVLAGHGTSDIDRRRFHNEAEAVASLDHSHIVPIYEVGEYEGRPYFSMKLVSGGSLDGQLTRYVLDPKAAARIMLPIARAVHYAHQRGVLHRDLKPSNILMGAGQEPYVTDFGLAKRLFGSGGSSEFTQLTESGAVVGTPGYMAPEQAQGKRSAVTTATDLHGLGAILYALLSGGPPFGGDDMWETLQQVRERAPQPPRELNSRVDRDLELICLKCLEKDPARRYDSAEILAGELERYLDGRPLLHTRAISRAERIWRWYVRHVVLASLAAALVLSLLVLTAGAIIAAVRFKALSDRDRQSRQRAEESRALASDVATQFLTDVSQSEQLKAHGLERLRRDLLLRAKDFWERITEQDTTDPAVHVERGKAYLRLGEIASALDANQEALSACEQGRSVFEQLSTSQPDVADYRDEMAAALHQLGNLYQKMRRDSEAEAAYGEARRIRQELVDAHPDIPRFRAHLGRTIFQYAVQEQVAGKTKESKETYEQARRIYAELAKEGPETADYQEALANTLFNMGLLQLTATPREYAKARETLENALSTYDQLLRRQPQKPEYQSAVARTLHHLGSIYRDSRQIDRADDGYKKASLLMERLFRDHPDVPAHRLNLVTLLHARGNLYFNSGRFDDARAVMERALSISEDLIKDYPDVPVYREELAKTYYDAACLYSLWSKHVTADATLPDPVKGKLRMQFADQAITLLRKSQTAGLFKQKSMLGTLKKDRDLDALRGRDDFKSFVANLEKEAASSPKEKQNERGR
jgi:serine/threonine-protein kinase